MKKILLSGLVLMSLLTNQKAFSQTTCALNPDFSDPDPTKIADGGSPGGGYEVGDVYVFKNVLPSVNAEVLIESKQGTFIFGLDNNSGQAERFQPFIASKTGNTEGYVQFAITFKRNSDNVIVPFSQLRLTGFDVDGDISQPEGAWAIREFVDVLSPLSVTLNSPTTLTDGGTVSDGSFTWRRVLGQSFQYTDPSNPIEAISNDPAHAFSAVYGSASVVRFRLGYAAQQDVSAGLNYSIEFGCFVEAENVPLPLTLLNFNGAYANNKSVLNWTTQSEVNVERFEVERSLDGNDFVKVGAVAAKGTSGTNDYQLTEDVTNVPGAIFYYRLKSLDKDGKFTYSKVVAVKRDTKLFGQISVTPNPIINGNGVIKITATTIGTADVKIVDFAGRIIMLQKVNLFEGVNVLPINVARQLSAGMYSIQLFKAGEVLTSKFVVGR